MSQQKGMSFKEFQQQFQTEEACEAFCFSSVGQMDLSARSVERAGAISFMGVGNMSVNSAIVKAQSRQGLSCTVPICR